MTLKRVRFFLATVLLAGGAFFNSSASAADAITTTAIATGTGAGVGQYTSQAIVNGNPAVSYYDVANGDLMYMRASDAVGSTWDAPVVVANSGDVGKGTSLVVVNGNPAIAYYDFTNGDLKYRRSDTANGISISDWGTPVTVDAGGNVGRSPSMAVVNGNPAISYYDVTNQDLKYVRATTVNGATGEWGTSQTLASSGDVGDFSSLVVVNGFPAICFYDATALTGGLKYMRATDTDGSAAWSTPILAAGTGTENFGFYTSMAIVNGNPAISFNDVDNQDLVYVRATNVNGTAWGSPVTLDSTGTVGWYTSLAIVHGYPAVSYRDQSNSDLKYVRATDLSGATWGTPVAVDSTGDSVGDYTSLVSLDGNAAISYFDATNKVLNWATITTPPVVTTPTSANVYSVSAKLGGNVTFDGGPATTARGVVYSITADNANPQIGGGSVTNATGSGTTGVFTVNVTGLTASTAYSYAAYATNSAGTTYSSVDTFTTQASQVAPVISSALTASGTYNSAIATYTITASNTPYIFSASGLPPGLAIDTATGAITGTPTDASGSPYSVTIGVNNGDGTDSATLVFTINKASQAAVSVNSSATGTFGTSYTATATGGNGGGAITFSLGTGSTASGAAVSSGGAVTSTGAGTVVINATRAASTNYLSATSADFTITLGKAAQAGLDVSGNTPTGTFGSSYTASYTGGSGTGAVTWTYVPGSAPGGAIDSSTGAVTSTGAGTVVFYVSKAADSNYLSAYSDNFIVTLGKATQATLSVSSSASGTFGSAYAATASGGSGGGAVTWSLGTGSTAAGAAVTSGGAVTSSGAGTVVIKATKATDTDYLSATSADFTVTLAKATQATLSVSSSASGTFNTAYAATSSGGSGSGAVTWSLGTGSTAAGAAVSSGGAVTSTGAGTVVINATKASDTDYLSATSADFTVTLAKATQATLSVSSSASGTFNTAYAAISSGGSGAGAVTWSLGTGSTAAGAAVSSGGAVTSTGAGTVVINATKASDTDYLSATSADFTVTLAKATQATLSVSSSASGTFNTAYAATSSGGSGAGAVTWSLGTGSTAAGAAVSSGGAVTSTGAGTVVIKATKAADTDYLSATSADFTVTLAKAAQATLSVSSSASGTFNTAYAAASSGGSGAGAVTWSLGTGSTAAGAAVSSGGAVTSTGAGTVVIKATKATDTDYLSATSADFTVTLAKATQATLSVSSSASGTFNTAYAATSSGGSGAGAVTWSLGTGSTAAGAAVSSGGAVTSTGAGTVVIKATKASDTDYLSATSADFTVTLAKATQATLSVSSSASGTFNTAYAATSSGGSGTGAVTWSLGTGSTAPGAAVTSGGAVSSTGVGTVVINVTKAADTDYLATTSADFTVTLAKATQTTLSVSSSASGTFGSVYAATSTGGSGTGAVTWSLGSGSTAAGAAVTTGGAVSSTGVGTVVIKVTKAADTNYLVASSADFTVTFGQAAQAALSVTSAPTSTFGAVYAATATGGSGTGSVTWSLGSGSTAAGAAVTAGGAVSSTGVGTVVIKATKAADTNYLVASSADFTVTLSAATATLTLGSLTATYDGAAHAATATTTPASLTVTFTYNGSATAPTNAGTYAVVGTISDANYTGSASGSLVIAQATPVITWAAPAPVNPGTALGNAQLNATANVAGAFTYSPVSGTVMTGGFQTLTASFAPTDTANYTSASAQQTLAVITAPVITTQPLSRPVFVGNTTTFTAVVSGAPTPSFQWQKNGIDIAGANSSSLTLNNIQLTDAGSYALIATNVGGTVTSRFARLVVLMNQPNAITYATTVSSTGVTAGGVVNFDYFVTNVGTKAWGATHYLSIRDVNNSFVAFSKLIGVLPGENTTANLSFPAPSTPGTYTYYVQALEDGVEFFSTQTTVTLTVLAPLPNSITYNTTTFPVSAAPGSNVIFTYNVTNTGTAAWGANHYLSLKNSGGTTLSSTPLTVLASGGSKTVNLSFTAPTTPGSYNYSVQASETGVGNFNTTANLTLVVLAPQPNAIVYNRVRYQDDVVPGATLSLKYTLSNAGTQAWGAGHYASLRDSNSTFLSFLPLNSTATSATKTVEFTLTAPTTPGIYTYYVQALEDGIEFFSTQDVVIVNVIALPRGNAVSYNTNTFPITAARGATVNFTANVTNRGTRTWGSTHYLSFRDVDNTFLAFPSLSGIAPGASRTCNLSMVAPTTPGIYTYTLEAFEDGVSFFEMSDTVVLIVP